MPESHWGRSADFSDSYITYYLQILTLCPISQEDARYIVKTLKVNLEMYPDICYLITETENDFYYTHAVGRTWI